MEKSMVLYKGRVAHMSKRMNAKEIYCRISKMNAHNDIKISLMKKYSSTIISAHKKNHLERYYIRYSTQRNRWEIIKIYFSAKYYYSSLIRANFSSFVFMLPLSTERYFFRFCRHLYLLQVNFHPKTMFTLQAIDEGRVGVPTLIPINFINHNNPYIHSVTFVLVDG